MFQVFRTDKLSPPQAKDTSADSATGMKGHLAWLCDRTEAYL